MLLLKLFSKLSFKTMNKGAMITSEWHFLLLCFLLFRNILTSDFVLQFECAFIWSTLLKKTKNEQYVSKNVLRKQSSKMCIKLKTFYRVNSGAQLGWVEKCPDFGKKCPDYVLPWVKFSIQNVVLNPKFFTTGSFFLLFLTKCLSKCPNSMKPPLPWKIFGCAWKYSFVETFVNCSFIYIKDVIYSAKWVFIQKLFCFVKLYFKDYDKNFYGICFK